MAMIDWIALFAGEIAIAGKLADFGGWTPEQWQFWVVVLPALSLWMIFILALSKASHKKAS